MAITAAFLQNLTYPAEQSRRGWYSPMLQRGATVGSITGGLIASTDLQVTYSGTGLGCLVSAGEAMVPGSSSNTQSGYYVYNSGSVSITPAAANPTNPRVDLVYAQVQDAAYTGASNQGVIAIATGTPTAGANLTNRNGAPVLPTSSLALAYVLVPANASSINSGDIQNVSTVFQPNIGSLTRASLPGIAFSAYRSAAANLTAGYNAFVFDATLFNIGSAYNTSTGVFQPKVAGLYRLSWLISASGTSSFPESEIADSTGSGPTFNGYVSGGANGTQTFGSVLVEFNGTNNGYQVSAGASPTVSVLTGSSPDYTYFMGELVGAS